MSTKPLRVDTNIRIVEFLDDTPEGALSNSVSWMMQDDPSGYTNAFYFLDLKIEHKDELGWLVSVYCGKPVRNSNSKKR